MTRSTYVFNIVPKNPIAAARWKSPALGYRIQAAKMRLNATRETRGGAYFDGIRARYLQNALFFDDAAAFVETHPGFQGWFTDSNPGAQFQAIGPVINVGGNPLLDPTNPAFSVGGVYGPAAATSDSTPAPAAPKAGLGLALTALAAAALLGRRR